MASSQGANKSLQVFRKTLRLLETPTLPRDIAKKRESLGHVRPRLNATQKIVIQEYRDQQQRSPSQNAKLETLAKNYLKLQEDIKERARLYELDASAEVVLSPKEMSRRAAARSGLQMPKLNPDLSPLVSDGDDENKQSGQK